MIGVYLSLTNKFMLFVLHILSHDMDETLLTIILMLQLQNYLTLVLLGAVYI